jgi:hypothetical protein
MIASESNLGKALNDHANRMSAIYSRDRVVPECECCGKRPVQKRIELKWRGIFHDTGTALSTAIALLVATGGGHGIASYRRIEFSTSHGFCKGCLNQVRIKKIVSELLEKLYFVILLLSAMWFGGMVVFGAVILFSKPNLHEVLHAIFFPCFGLIGLVAGFWVANKTRLYCVPVPLRSIARHPFQLLKVKQDFIPDGV